MRASPVAGLAALLAVGGALRIGAGLPNIVYVIADDLGSIPPWDAALRAHLPFLVDE